MVKEILSKLARSWMTHLVKAWLNKSQHESNSQSAVSMGLCGKPPAQMHLRFQYHAISRSLKHICLPISKVFSLKKKSEKHHIRVKHARFVLFPGWVRPAGYGCTAQGQEPVVWEPRNIIDSQNAGIKGICDRSKRRGEKLDLG